MIVEYVGFSLQLTCSSNPTGAEFDPEEDEPTLEAAWPHLQVLDLAPARIGWSVMVCAG